MGDDAQVGPESPTYDLMLRGGILIDPVAGTAQRADVAVNAGRIARIARDIPPTDAARVVDVAGKYVTPGWRGHRPPKIRGLAFLNVVDAGMLGEVEQDVSRMNSDLAAEVACAHPDTILSWGSRLPIAGRGSPTTLTTSRGTTSTAA